MRRGSERTTSRAEMAKAFQELQEEWGWTSFSLIPIFSVVIDSGSLSGRRSFRQRQGCNPA